MMRRPVIAPRRGQASRTVSVSAPIGGWNARDSIAQMPPEDAVILTNWFPTPSTVVLRQGSTNWATGLGNQVNSIMPYNPAGGPGKLFAAAGGSVFDVTSAGAVGSPVISSLSSDKWKYANFATSAGPFLGMVNGSDGYYVYNGTSWQQVTSGSSPISITGVDPTTLSDVVMFAQRLFFIQKGSLNVYYLPVSSVGGAATLFPMQSLFPRGGQLIAMGVWTVDGGYGMQDYLCFVTSEGEIAVYQGTDPSQATTWSKVGVYQVGNPMGNRCFMKYGGDLLYIGKDGLGPISRLLASSRVNTQVDLSYKIQTAISAATSAYASNFGWDLVLHPTANALILNVPIGLGQQQQYVMNTITGAWSNFTGWPANCWARFNDAIYYGGNGVVVHAWTTANDDNGGQIVAEALPAFNYFGTSQLKEWTMVRPIFQSSGTPGVSLGLNVDFDTTAPTSTPSFSGQSGALWDQALWDQAQWGGSQQMIKNWQTVAGVGYAAAMHMKVSALDVPVSWVSTDYLMMDGAVL
jgi:hypothetical protein